MSRRVKQYLSKLNVITNEDELRDMSLKCEPPAGSGKKIYFMYNVCGVVDVHLCMCICVRTYEKRCSGRLRDGLL